MPDSLPAKIALTVLALIIGVTLGVWPNVKPGPPSAPPSAAAQDSPRPAPQAQPSAAALADAGTPLPADSPAQASPGSEEKPALAPQRPAAPSAVTVTTLQETRPALHVKVSWKVGSGNGRAITGHRLTIRTNRGYVSATQTGAGGDGGAYAVPCGSQVCDGLRIDAEVRAVNSVGESNTGRASLTYSAPYLVGRELRSDQGASTSAKAQENARAALPGLRNSILASGVACTGWQERVISVYSTPDGTWYVFAGIVSGTCKY